MDPRGRLPLGMAVRVSRRRPLSAGPALISSAIMFSHELDNRVRKLGPHRRRDW